VIVNNSKGNDRFGAKLTRTSIVKSSQQKTISQAKKYKNRLSETGSIIQAAKWVGSFKTGPS
jgi:hypothetical protein